MVKKIVVFNGPPRSGKDTMTDHMWTVTPSSARLKMSQPLKDGVKALFRLTDAQMSHLERIKDEPSDLLHGYTFREMQIKISEEWLKPTFGNDIFGKIAAQYVTENIHNHVLFISDGGFLDELVPLHLLVGHANFLVVQLHRRSTDFSNDSRGYIVHPDVRGKTMKLGNSGSLKDTKEMCQIAVTAWIQGGDLDER
jgi:hypothetical protein